MKRNNARVLVKGRIYKNSSNSVGISYLYPNYYVVHGNASVTDAALYDANMYRSLCVPVFCNTIIHEVHCYFIHV